MGNIPRIAVEEQQRAPGFGRRHEPGVQLDVVSGDELNRLEVKSNPLRGIRKLSRRRIWEIDQPRLGTGHE